MDQLSVLIELTYYHPQHTGPNGTAKRNGWNGERVVVFSRRRPVLDRVNTHKGIAAFSEPEDDMYKDHEGLQGTSGVRINIKSNYVLERNARKIAHYSALKIEATKGTEMKISHSQNTAAQPTPSLDLYPSV